MPQPLKNKLTCNICNLFCIDCQCKDSDGDKYEPDLEQDIFIGSDVESAVKWLKEQLIKTMKPEKGKCCWDYTKVGDLIDKAFPDLNTDSNEKGNENNYKVGDEFPNTFKEVKK